MTHSGGFYSFSIDAVEFIMRLIVVVFRSLALRLLNSELPDHVIKVFAFVQIFFITGRNPSEVVLAQVKCDQLKKA